ncbi:MFS transporter [Psychromonas sp. PT13]|uniref:MFS transporter n=1 Tax=Psychromonas sp. PT13 TaxID=3439547 RepID=UPI003EBC3EAF
MKNKIITYLFARFFDGISSGMFMMALPWVMLQQDNMGFFVAITALVCTTISFVFTPFFATWIDRYSRKKILILMQIIQSITALLIFIAYYNQYESHWLLAVAQLIFWTTNDMAWCCNNAFTQENFKRDEYAKLASYEEIVMQSTTLTASALGIILLENWSMVAFSTLAAMASFLSACCYIMTPYQRKLVNTLKQSFLSQLTQSKKIFAKQIHFYCFLALSCLSYPVLTFMAKLVPIYFSEQNVDGALFATWNMSYGLGALLSGLVIARLLVRFDNENAMIFSMFTMAALLIIMGSYLSPTLIIGLTLIIGFFNSYNRIARTNKLHHVIAINERGRVDGGLKLFSTMAQSISYVVIALLSYAQLTELGFVLAGIVLLIAATVMLQFRSRFAYQLA